MALLQAEPRATQTEPSNDAYGGYPPTGGQKDEDQADLAALRLRIDSNHVGSTVRAIRDYAALLKNPSAHKSGPASTASRWWKGLFG